MLLWDRATSGLYDSQGEHPIHVVPTQAEAGAARAVVLGEDLLLSYPLFLGANAMLYP